MGPSVEGEHDYEPVRLRLKYKGKHGDRQIRYNVCRKQCNMYCATCTAKLNVGIEVSKQKLIGVCGLQSDRGSQCVNAHHKAGAQRARGVCFDQSKGARRRRPPAVRGHAARRPIGAGVWPRNVRSA